MKILIVTNSTAGLYNFRRMLIERLLQENTVIAYSPYNGSEDELQRLGCQLKELAIDRRGMNPIKDRILYKKILAEIEKEKPDLVVTYTIKPNIYASFACKRKGIPYAVNITGLGTAFEKGALLEKVVVTMYREALKKAKVVFFENEYNRQLFIRKRIVNENKTCLLMGAGVDLDRFTVLPYPKNEIFRFIFIGRIMHEKGIDELFEAMKILYSEDKRVVLDVCGSYEENYQEKIERYSKEGWLNYLGRQDDVRPYIGAADCFILPSYHEGMANTNLESASSGRPIITSNIPGCKEAVVDGSGFLCEPKNVDSIYEAMRKMVSLSSEQREKMGLIGRQHMEEVFDKRKVVEITISNLLTDD